MWWMKIYPEFSTNPCHWGTSSSWILKEEQRFLSQPLPCSSLNHQCFSQWWGLRAQTLHTKCAPCHCPTELLFVVVTFQASGTLPSARLTGAYAQVCIYDSCLYYCSHLPAHVGGGSGGNLAEHWRCRECGWAVICGVSHSDTAEVVLEKEGLEQGQRIKNWKKSLTRAWLLLRTLERDATNNTGKSARLWPCEGVMLWRWVKP